MSDLRQFIFTVRDGDAAAVTEESEAFLSVARHADGLPLQDATGKVIGTFYATPDHVWDDATGIELTEVATDRGLVDPEIARRGGEASPAMDREEMAKVGPLVHGSVGG